MKWIGLLTDTNSNEKSVGRRVGRVAGRRRVDSCVESERTYVWRKCTPPFSQSQLFELPFVFLTSSAEIVILMRYRIAVLTS
jgi:hypothetical protein